MNCNLNNQTMCSCQAQPIIMPTQYITRQVISYMEQPIIYPVECRCVNRVVLVPRCYRAYTQPTGQNTMNGPCCPKGQ